MKKISTLHFIVCFLLFSHSTYSQILGSAKVQNPQNSVPEDLIEFSDLSWVTLRGEERHYDKTCEMLQSIIEEYKILGVAIALTQAKSYGEMAETLLLYLGVENPETGRMISGNTIFYAGRLGQPVFAYMIMKLYTGRRLDIDVPPSSILAPTHPWLS